MYCIYCFYDYLFTIQFINSSNQVAFLGTFFSENLPFADLLRTLNPLSKILNKICSLSPSIAPRLGSDELKCRGDDVVSVWTRESKHNYENNLKITEVGPYPSPMYLTMLLSLSLSLSRIL